MPIERIPDGYEPEQFEVFPAGKCVVTGFNWMTKDDDGSPIFKAQSGERLIARYRTVLTDGNDGPPGSVDWGQVPLLVRAFGGDAALLPPHNQPNQRLIIAERLVAESDKKVTVDVNDSGWIRSVLGMEMPPGYYRFEYYDIGTKNRLNEPSWMASSFGEGGKFFTVIMTVTGDSVGKVTPWDHVRVREYMQYALDLEDGQLVWQRTDNGSWSYNSTNMHNFMVAACGPDIMDSGFENINNVVPEIDAAAKLLGRTFLGIVERAKRANRRTGHKRTVLRLGQLSPVPEFAEAEEVDADTRGEEPSLLDQLYDVLNGAMDGNAFGADGKLTDEAKAWWNDLKGIDPGDGEEVVGIVAFTKKHQIPRAFDQMGDDDVKAILAWMGKGESGDF